MVPQVRTRAARALAAALLTLSLPAPLVAATHAVPAGGDLQAALDAAQPGDVILLAPGATYTGSFKLPVKNGDAYITLRTGAAAGQVPSAGQRISPEFSPVLAKVQSPNSAPALATAPGAHHWRIELIEFLATAKGAGDIITLGSGAAQQTHAAQMPHSLVLDRLYVHGDPVVGQKRGVALNSGATQILNSYFADIKSVGQDSQAIAGWNGSGPYLIENNYLEAAGENLLFGGADPGIANLVPSDITIRRNLMTKPLQWRGEKKWQVKNAFELKSARRVLVEGNVFEHVWLAAQNGFAVLFTPRNQNGGAPWSVIEDVTFQYNVIRHAGGAFNLAGYDDLRPSRQTRRVRIAHNLIYDIGRAWGGSGHFLTIGHSPADVVVEHNTVWHGGNAINAHGKRDGAPAPIEHFVFRDNLLKHNKYGVIGDSLGVGSATLNAYFPGVVFERNALAGGKASQYPAGNYFPTLEEFEAAFVNAAGEDFTLVPWTALRSAAQNGRALGVDLPRLDAATRGATPQTPPGADADPLPESAADDSDQPYWPPTPPVE